MTGAQVLLEIVLVCLCFLFGIGLSKAANIPDQDGVSYLCMLNLWGLIISIAVAIIYPTAIMFPKG